MPSDARCAQHPDAPAAATCARCGTFACSRCLVGSLCLACSQRVPAPSALPLWERREAERVPLHLALISTVRELLLQPRRFFEGVAAGESLRPASELAMLSAALSPVVSWLSFAVTLELGGRHDLGAASLSDFALGLVAVLLAPLRVLLTAAFVTLAARVTGLGLAGYRVTARAVGYLSVLGVLDLAPWVGRPLLVVAMLAYGSLALAAIHRVPWYRGLLAVLAMGLPLLCAFVAAYQYFARAT